MSLSLKPDREVHHPEKYRAENHSTIADPYLLAQHLCGHSLPDLQDTLGKVQDKKKHKLILRVLMYLGIASAAGCIAWQAFAQLPSPAETTREICRREVAGHFLKNHDEALHAEKMLSYLENKKKELEKELASTHQAIAQTEEQLRRKDYNARVAATLNRFKSKAKLINQSLGQNQTLQLQYHDRLKSARDISTNFRTAISSVFAFKKIKGTGDGYKIQIDYRQSCPPYRFNCPLTKEFATKLRGITADNFSLPLACKRYSHYLQHLSE